MELYNYKLYNFVISTCVAPASSFMWGSRKDSKVASPQKQMKLSTKGMKMVGFYNLWIAFLRLSFIKWLNTIKFNSILKFIHHLLGIYIKVGEKLFYEISLFDLKIDFHYFFRSSYIFRSSVLMVKNRESKNWEWTLKDLVFLKTINMCLEEISHRVFFRPNFN